MIWIATKAYRSTRTRICCMALAAVAVCSPLGIYAADNLVNQYRITKQVIAAGGSRTTGGQYRLVGTIGQATTGRAEQGDIQLQQGFHAQLGSRPDLMLQDSFE